MTRDEVVTKLAKASKTPQHELVTDMMDSLGVTALKDITDEQADAYYKAGIGEAVRHGRTRRTRGDGDCHV